MDGTAALFDGLLPHLGPARAVRYDPHRALTYDELTVALPDDDVILLGESFSGPLSIRLASDPRVRGLVLCATFARFPYPPSLCAFARWVLRAPWPMHPPALAVRAMLTGFDCPAPLVARVGSAIREVAHPVFRTRLREVLRVDERRAFEALDIPVVYLQARYDRLVPAARVLRDVAARLEH